MSKIGPSDVVFQNGFRARLDTVAESVDDTWITPLNTNWIAPELNTNFRVRFLIQRNAHGSDTTDQFTLQYSHNNGSFVTVTSSTSVIQCVTSNVAGYDDDDDTTQLIGSGSFITPNACVNAGDFLTGVVNWPTSGSNLEVETEWVLKLIGSDLRRGDSVELRIRDAFEAPLNGPYNEVPIISIQRARVQVEGNELQLKGKPLVLK